jgi:thiol-disulfide isomerase/thioredoxin
MIPSRADPEPRMRRTLPILAILGLLAAGAAPAAEVPIETAAPEPLPPLTFQTMDGQEASLANYAGKVVVLNLWATWCAPCREEMPSLDRLQAQFADRGLVVLALSVDRAGPERVQQFLDEIGVKQLHVYRDPKAAATRAVKVPGLPATLLVDRRGNEVGRVLGIAQWDGPAAVAAVEKLLAEPAG